MLAQNRRVLDAITPLPGTAVVRDSYQSGSSAAPVRDLEFYACVEMRLPYERAQLLEKSGWITYRDHRLRARTAPQKVLNHYVAMLRRSGWHSTERYCFRRRCSASFERAERCLSIQIGFKWFGVTEPARSLRIATYGRTRVDPECS